MTPESLLTLAVYGTKVNFNVIGQWHDRGSQKQPGIKRKGAIAGRLNEEKHQS